MDIVTPVLVFIVQAVVVFIASTTVFDVVHFFLHRWQRSRIPLFRLFNSWHQVHHDFLDKQMQVHPELKAKNLWAHLVPEFLTSVVVTAAFLLVFPAWPVLANLALQSVLFVLRVREEGIDVNHMSMDRLDGRRGLWFVSPSYHAMHHIHPLGFYSSMLNVFDVLFGTAAQIRGKRVAITGATGAYGAAMAAELERLGARVTRVPREEEPDYAGTDILVLAHGAKHDPDACWAANFGLTIQMGTQFIAAGRDRLVPPEIWAVGSEAEMYGFDDYAMSKRAFADYAATYWRASKDVTYRHIVPAAFRSRMGWAPFDAKWAARGSLFWIRRGFSYIPVTYTGLAFFNWFFYRARGAVKPA